MIREYSSEGTKEPDWEVIMNESFTLGEYIRINFGGQWSLDGPHELPFIIDISSIKNVKANPLFFVSRFWGKPYYEPYSLKLCIEGLQQRINLEKE